jgi:hypothetical protein
VAHHPTFTDNVLSGLPRKGGKGPRPMYGSYALVSDDPNTDTAVVFVHGFLGDAYGTWIDFQRMIDGHAKVPEDWNLADLFFVQYSSFRKSIANIALLILRLVPQIFPTPPTGLFRIDDPVQGVPETVIQSFLTPHSYKKLFLVGHSEGGAVLRNTVVMAIQKNELQEELKNAEMNLFAPAHGGFQPTGWVGACLAVGRIDAIAMTVLNLSPAFVEMNKGKVLETTQDSTNTYAEQKPNFKPLRARVVFGENEHIVARLVFTYDNPVDDLPGEDHSSICKPRPDYPDPLKFAIGLNLGKKNKNKQ